jgi:nitroreductase
MPEEPGLFEIIHSLRAMRRLKPDPVPDDLIRQILLAGQAAASGGNTQRWRFLVLKDPEIKNQVQVYYKGAGLLQEGLRRGGRAALCEQPAAAGLGPWQV